MGVSRIMLALVASLLAAVPSPLEIAEARQPKTKKECLDKYNACGRRCAGRTSDYPACIRRTCDPQYDRCIENLPEGGSKRGDERPGSGGIFAPTDPKPRLGHGPFSPVTPGILNTSPGMPAQGPAPMGAPAAAPAAPSAPPVIIR